MSATSTPEESLTASGSSAASLVDPQPLSFTEIDLDFAESQRSFTGLIQQCWDNDMINPITKNKRKRRRLQILCYLTGTSIMTRRVTAYLLDEWSDIIDYFCKYPQKNTKKNDEKNSKKKKRTQEQKSWNKAYRENSALSITFYGVSVEKIPDEDRDPLGVDKAFIVDTDTPNDAWIEIKTCCQRIAAKNGIRMNESDVLNHLGGRKLIDFAYNCNVNFLVPEYPYCPMSELKDSAKCFVYGYVTSIRKPSACRGMCPCVDLRLKQNMLMMIGRHHYSMKIMMRDGSMDWDADDLMIMIFGNDPNKFPNCREGDLLRFHRIEMNDRSRDGMRQFQGVMNLDKKYQSFVVFDGNLTMPNTRESQKHSSSEQFTFDDKVDGYLIKYLKEACRLRQEQTNPDLLMMINNNNNNNNRNMPAALGVNQRLFLYLNEIKAEHERINLMVMIRGRLMIDDNDEETMKFYWIIWDGSHCKNNGDLLQFYEHNYENDENENDVLYISNFYKNEFIIGSCVKLLVLRQFEDAIECWNGIKMGSFCELTNVFVDTANKCLVFDDESNVLNQGIKIMNNNHIQLRLRRIYFNIEQETNVITHCHSMVRHNQHQSYSVIDNIKRQKQTKCRYKIRGKCVGFYPKQIEKIVQKNNDEFVMRFALNITDSSGGELCVLFADEEAKMFLGIKEVNDKTMSSFGQLLHIQQCFKLIEDERSILDICIRSYQPKGKQLLVYKAFDTVLLPNV